MLWPPLPGGAPGSSGGSEAEDQGLGFRVWGLEFRV